MGAGCREAPRFPAGGQILAAMGWTPGMCLSTLCIFASLPFGTQDRKTTCVFGGHMDRLTYRHAQQHINTCRAIKLWFTLTFPRDATPLHDCMFLTSQGTLRWSPTHTFSYLFNHRINACKRYRTVLIYHWIIKPIKKNQRDGSMARSFATKLMTGIWFLVSTGWK